jgi:hypothetical protein
MRRPPRAAPRNQKNSARKVSLYCYIPRMGSKATHVTLSYHLCYVAATVGEKKSAKSRGAVSPGGTSDPNDPDDPGETQSGVPGDPGARRLANKPKRRRTRRVGLIHFPWAAAAGLGFAGYRRSVKAAAAV